MTKHIPSPPVPLASQHPRRTTCPTCKSPDVRVSDGTPSEKLRLFTRATFCRDCWWSLRERLIDDSDRPSAGTHNTATTRRA